MKSVLAWSSAFVIACCAATSATAAPKVFFAENLNPEGKVDGTPVTARASFLSDLVGVGSQGFEAPLAPNKGVDPLTVQFAGSGDKPIAATLEGGKFGVVNEEGVGESGSGRFNTTPNGSQWWLSIVSFTINFNTPISAFGFYGTDIGDFGGKLTINLENEAGNTELVVDNAVGRQSGSLLFWGFIDPTASYRKITFGNTAPDFDAFGFDDMVIGDLGQIKPPNGVPEPVTLVLVGTALLGVAATRRRRLAA